LTDGLVRLERDGRVGVIVIDNPPINAGSTGVRIGLMAAIAALTADPELDAGVLIGAGSTFIAGSDLREFSAPLVDPQTPVVIAALEDCPKPIVAAIHGAALGGGYEITLGCDARVAVADAVVGLPEITYGIMPGAGGTVKLPRLTDAATALEIITSCRRLKAPEAQALGMIDAVVTDLRADAAAYALKLGGKRRVRDLPPKPGDADAFERMAESALKKGRGRPHVQEAIAAVRRALVEPFGQALASEREVFQRLRVSDESAALRHIFFTERAAGRGPKGVEALSVGSVGVIGAGTMGVGIVTAFLAGGYPVVLFDANAQALEAAQARIAENLARGGKADAASRLTPAGTLEAVADCDLIVEAVFEEMAVKTALMASLDAIAKPGAVLASNTSYLDLDEIAAATNRPEMVVGLHFFAPAHVMKLLEIVRGAKTAPQVLATAFAVGRKLGKISVEAGVCEGFIGNRMYHAYRVQSEAMLLDGASPQEVDAAIEAFGFAMGPFAAWDMSGLDIAWANRRRKQALDGAAGHDFPVLEWLNGEGRLGQKTGSGWYAYAGEPLRRAPDAHVAQLIERARRERGIAPRPLMRDEIQARALGAIVNEALLILEDGVAAQASDIDLVLLNGYGFPRHVGGPLHWAARQDPAELGRILDQVVSGAVRPTRRGDLKRLG